MKICSMTGFVARADSPIPASAAKELVGSLANGSGDWRSVEAEEGTHWLNVSELVYIRLVPGEPARVGFGGS